MGLRGPKPAPMVVKLGKGERRPSRVNRSEPDLPAPTSIEAPRGLTGVGRREWQRLAPTLVSSGVLTEADLSAFEDYCRALSNLRTCEAAAARLGLELAIAKGVHGAMVKLRSQVAQLRAHLGLTPSSRTSVKAKPPRPGGKLELFLGRKYGLDQHGDDREIS